jgi:hypothetical protein
MTLQPSENEGLKVLFKFYEYLWIVSKLVKRHTLVSGEVLA